MINKGVSRGFCYAILSCQRYHRGNDTFANHVNSIDTLTKKHLFGHDLRVSKTDGHKLPINMWEMGVVQHDTH